jgi:hypothetical protein
MPLFGKFILEKQRINLLPPTLLLFFAMAKFATKSFVLVSGVSKNFV